MSTADEMDSKTQEDRQRRRSPIRLIVSVVLLAFVGASVGYLIWTQISPRNDVADAKGDLSTGTRVTVYYFYTNTRCASCGQIEAWTRDTLKATFPTELANGSIQWKPINVEESGNDHFIKDFSLKAKTVVVCRIVDGQTVEWKDLIDVWRFLSNNSRFSRLIADNVREYLQKS
jgi:hypothetical protein